LRNKLNIENKHVLIFCQQIDYEIFRHLKNFEPEENQLIFTRRTMINVHENIAAGLVLKKHQVAAPGQRVMVLVREVDIPRKRIVLSMKSLA